MIMTDDYKVFCAKCSGLARRHYTVEDGELITVRKCTQCNALTDEYCDCCVAGNHNTQCYGRCGIECCHPLYHTDWERADQERLAEVEANIRRMESEEE